MPLVVRDGNGTSQTLPNAGIDAVYYAIEAGTITTTATSATNVYQFVGAAGVVARLRKIEMWGGAIVSAVTFAASTTLARLKRESTAGTTGTWTAITGTGKASNAFANAASSVTLNVAGTTAFTVGTTQGIIRQGYVQLPWSGGATSFTPGIPLIWLFGVNGDAPVSFTGTADYIVVNLNAVTPVGPLFASFEWEEATT